MKTLMTIALIMCVAAFAEAGEKKAKGQTKEEYVAAVKKSFEKKGKKFVQANIEAKFVKNDTNKDGILTQAEKKAGQKKIADQKKKKAE